MPNLTAHRVAARYRLAKESPSAESLASFIGGQLGPLFKDYTFGVYPSIMLGEHSVAVDFFQAPKGSTGAVLWSAPKYVKIWIHADNWKRGSPAPAQVTAEVARISGIKKMRKTSGPLDKVVSSVISWFRNNQKDLTSGTDL